MIELGSWLRRRRPTRIVCQPSGKEWPRPESRPWAQLADLAGQAESVEAYRDAQLLGVWQRPAGPPHAGAPSRGGKESDGGAVGAGARGPCAACGSQGESFLRMELDGLREIVRMQQTMLREVIASQSMALRSVRASAGVAPVVDDEDGDDDELDGLLRGVLAQKMGGAADGLSTQQMLASVLSRAGKPV